MVFLDTKTATKTDIKTDIKTDTKTDTRTDMGPLDSRHGRVTTCPPTVTERTPVW